MGGRAEGGGRSAAERTGLPELTPQELHIATLVGEGKTNKEIGAAIYLSPKTVQYHLANTYRKLDIHSRAELARIMAGEHVTGNAAETAELQPAQGSAAA